MAYRFRGLLLSGVQTHQQRQRAEREIEKHRKAIKDLIGVSVLPLTRV